MYIEDGMVVGRFVFRNSFPSIDPILEASLIREFSIQEVHDALFEMAPLKALGIDVLHAQFYQ